MLVHREEHVLPARQRAGLANLWQMPVLLLSLGLFTLAAYLFIDPQPAPAYQTQAALASIDLGIERFDAAIGRLNDLLATRPEPAQEAEARLLLAEVLDLQLRRNRRLDTPGAHRRIIAEIQRAYTLGHLPTIASSDRLARSHEALGEVNEAAANYQRAVDLVEQGGKPQRAMPMRRSAIDMLIAFDRQASALEAINRFMAVPGLTDDERAWALGELARLHIDAGRHTEAQSLLSAAAALAPDLAIQGQVSFRVGYAAWKLGQREEARRHLLLARRQLGDDHPQDAEVCYLLGRIAQDAENYAESIAWLDLALAGQPDERMAARAAVARAMVFVLSGEADAGAAELATLANEVAHRPALQPVKAALLETVQRSGRILAAQQRYELALNLLEIELELDTHGTPDALARRSRYMDGMIEQAQAAEASSETFAGAQSLRLPELRGAAAATNLKYALELAAAGDPGYPRVLWEAASQLELAGSPVAAAEAMQHFIGVRPDDEIVPEALFRIARLQLASGEDAQGLDTLDRLRNEHAQSPQALHGAVLLAHRALREQRFEQALALLDELPAQPDIREPLRAQVAFLRGDCQRQLALATIESASASEQGRDSGAQLASAITDSEARRRLETAQGLYSEAIDIFSQSQAMTQDEKDCERLATFGRAHCAFDLGRYEEAIDLYQQAAARYGDDVATLTATLQIASANAALGRASDLRQAAQEVRRLLERLQSSSFETDLVLPRRYWRRWLNHVEATGLW